MAAINKKGFKAGLVVGGKKKTKQLCDGNKSWMVSLEEDFNNSS